MDAKTLIAKALARREQWVELEPGKRVRIRRPAETEMPALRHGVSVDQAIACTVGWDGFTEIDVEGEAVGSDEPVPFDVELWGVLARDKVDWISAVSSAIVEAITAHLQARDDAAKN